MRSGNRREYYLSYYGPLSLIALLALWATLFVIGFGLIQWGLDSPLNIAEKSSTLGTYLYLSGTTFITLGLGDVIPLGDLARFLTVIEAGIGFGFLALIIGYVPVIYQAFSRREINISLMDARAGSPSSASELIRRHRFSRDPGEIVQYLREWERWCAELLESHLSYPVLAYYRSQHQSQSWLGALTTILDTCALILVGIEDIPVKPAKFVFAIARHTAVDLSQVFGAIPKPKVSRLSPEDFARLRSILAAKGILLSDGEATEKKLTTIRGMYEPFVDALARRFLITLPPWIAPDDEVDDWQTSAWDHFLETSPHTVDRAIRAE